MNMQTAPERIESPLYTVAQIRQMEQALFARQDSYAVMQYAAQAVCDVITADFPMTTPNQCVHVVLGAGNNAGDGLLVAAGLKQRGFTVRAYRVFDKAFHGDAKKAYDVAVAEKLSICPFFPFAIGENDIVIEAIFGIGFSRPASGAAEAAIAHINACQSRHPALCIYAIDVPAGVVCDTGTALGSALLADKTITFIGDKIGLHTAAGKGQSGTVIIAPLGATPIPQKSPINRYHYPKSRMAAEANNHKGDYGHALVIGGGRGMFGATALASVSALKVGTGKASIYCHSDYASQFHLDGTPLYEVMRKGDLADLSPYSAVVLGVGLGRDDWGKAVFEKALAATAPNQALLIDADGLWHLASHDANDGNEKIAVITPHEAEAARLLATTVERIRADKVQAVRQLAQTYHCIAVLKGAGTLISDGERVWINESGNVCLATAGTGDVLAGMIGGYLAQGYDSLNAALYGVFRHGLAADNYLAQHGEKTMRASDLWAWF